MKNFLREHYPFLILLILVLATRFLFLSYPAEVVFDEVHFGKFVSAYFTQQYYFDIHPPLGKLMIAGVAKLFDFQPGLSFEKIGEVANARTLLGLRFLPALFGSLFVLLIYPIVRALGGSKGAAFLGSFLILFDNAFLVESKFILVDSFLFFFSFLSVWLFLLARKQNTFSKQIVLYILAALASGLSFSIKWTGLSFWGIIVAFIFFDLLKNFKSQEIKKTFLKLSVFIVIPLAIYLIPFVIHFNLLTHSGSGDAFMSLDFQRTLVGNNISSGIEPLPFWNRFVELNQAMFSYSSGLKKEHPDSSRWYQWPLMKKPVWYWTHSTGSGQVAESRSANIYLWGNPVVWSSALIGLFLGVWFLLKERKYAVSFLFLGYLANLLPFIFVGRVAFLYHYLPSLAFAVLLFAVLAGRFFDKHSSFFYLSSERLSFAYFGYLALVSIFFLVVAPLTYGFFVDPRFSSVLQFLIRLFH
ncbi:MAG: phospholipid carrier-dependent glycosyltransferase [bacterium]|nr:phospholipid carrier-dependent glycosyltransferase [bacterium]